MKLFLRQIAKRISTENKHLEVYSVHLGNVQFREFKNEKAAKAYLVKCADQLASAATMVLGAYRLAIFAGFGSAAFMQYKDIEVLAVLRKEFDESLIHLVKVYSESNNNAPHFRAVVDVLQMANAVQQMIQFMQASGRGKYSGTANDLEQAYEIVQAAIWKASTLHNA
jgi:hypothetical protein